MKFRAPGLLVSTSLTVWCSAPGLWVSVRLTYGVENAWIVGQRLAYLRIFRAKARLETERESGGAGSKIASLQELYNKMKAWVVSATVGLRDKGTLDSMVSRNSPRCWEHNRGTV